MAVVFDPFVVLKHGSHDQSSHGNWARGGGQYRENDHRSIDADLDWTDLGEDGIETNGLLKDHLYEEWGSGVDRRADVLKDKNAREVADEVLESMTPEERASLYDDGEPVSYNLDNYTLFEVTAVESWQNQERFGIRAEGYKGFVAEVAIDDGLDPEQSARQLWDQMSDHAKSRVLMYGAANEMQRSWASSASDGEFPILLQTLALRKFPGKHPSFVDYSRKRVPGNVDFTPKQEMVYGRIMDSHYERTQKLINDVDPQSSHVTLYRGFRTWDQMNVGSNVKIQANPLSSWSLDFTVANNFTMMGDEDYAYIFEATVPKANIVSSTLTGLGSLSEQEFVVSAPSGVKVKVAA